MSSAVASPLTPPPSTSRPGRLRGLSVARLIRATSYPSPSSSAPGPAPQTTSQPTASSQRPRRASQLSAARLSIPENTDIRGTSSTPAAPSAISTVAATDLAAMARTRSATTGGATDSQGDMQASQNANGSHATPGSQLPSIRFSAHQDPRAQRPSLVFSPMSRILPTGLETIKVGRYSERDTQPLQAVNVPSAAAVGFKSKVVSRRHCEFWCTGGRWFIKDVKSSSGTFLNHIRLSSPGTESRPFPVNDGDIVQLGIDFKGGEEMIFRCVKIRVELNKGWQTGPNSFNVQSHKRLRELSNMSKSSSGSSSQDCSICLGPIAPCQSLFVAPCSHTWHYKCIRVIINGPHWPHFICPNCRTVADLEAELEDPYANAEWEEVDDSAAADSESAAPESMSTPRAEQINGNRAEPIEADNEADNEAGNEADNEALDGGNNYDEVLDTSDDSGDHAVDQAADALGYMNIEGTPSPTESVESHPGQTSNATVAPVDIIARKPVPLSSVGHHRLEHAGSQLERSARTPSPHTSSASDAAHGVEGPMTPRNDVGPFVFDGLAGRSLDPRSTFTATMGQTLVADTPTPHSHV